MLMRYGSPGRYSEAGTSSKWGSIGTEDISCERERGSEAEGSPWMCAEAAT